MDSVAVMEVAAVPDPVFVGATPLLPVGLPLMEAMDSVAVMEAAAVPDQVFVGATPLQPPPPMEASASLALRRSARCLNRPRAPNLRRAGGAQAVRRPPGPPEEEDE